MKHVFKHQTVPGLWPLEEHSSVTMPMKGSRFQKLYSADQALSALNWYIKKKNEYKINERFWGLWISARQLRHHIITESVFEKE